MPTPVTSATAYCTAARLLMYGDIQYLADWAADDGTGQKPTRAELLDATSIPGGILALHLQRASSDVEEACFARGHYTPADLAALTGNAAVGLEALVSGLTMWSLARRRNPVTAKVDDVPGAKAALDQLENLRSGAWVFGLQSQIDAGAGMEATPFVDVTAPGRTVNKAGRYFGRRGSC